MLLLHYPGYSKMIQLLGIRHASNAYGKKKNINLTRLQIRRKDVVLFISTWWTLSIGKCLRIVANPER
jgi:hypothetical protein